MGVIFLRNRVSGVAPFDPATLFASGEAGVWYDPSDLTTMWSDVAATVQTVAVLEGSTPTTANLVAQIDDKSGNGNHATQGTEAHRPVLRVTSGGLYYLEFDGSDDRMVFSQVTSVSGASCFMGVKFDTISTNSLIYEGSYPILAYTASFVQDFSLGARTGAASLYAEDGATNLELRSTPIGTSNPYVITGFSSSSGSGIRLDGGATVTGAGTRDDLIVRALGRDSPSRLFNGNLYGVIFRGVTSTATEISNTETYLANRSGVTL